MALTNPVAITYGTGGRAVTPSDTASFPPSLIYVGTVGDVAVMPADQETAASPAAVTFTAVPVGTTLPIMAIRVMATNTTTGAGRTGITRIS